MTYQPVQTTKPITIPRRIIGNLSPTHLTAVCMVMPPAKGNGYSTSCTSGFVALVLNTLVFSRLFYIHSQHSLCAVTAHFYCCWFTPTAAPYKANTEFCWLSLPFSEIFISLYHTWFIPVGLIRQQGQETRNLDVRADQIWIYNVWL